tara:strand:- start:216 stop:971 length:756 start_codon:yes stop_codon:yes gene_type:complete
MSKIFTKKNIERFSRQIILKNVGPSGQRKILNSKVLVIGLGGLGCPVVDQLCRAGVGTIGIVDFDKVSLSNLHRQSLYNSKDLKKFKVDIVKRKIKLINPKIKIKKFKKKISESNASNLIKNFEIIIDGSDNFKTKFLINKISIKYSKTLIVGAISKFDGHVFAFNFKNKNEPCLKCFYQSEPSDDLLNCEREGILGPVAGIIGSLQANEALKRILQTKNYLEKKILILDTLKLNFKEVLFNKKRSCMCKA